MTNKLLNIFCAGLVLISFPAFAGTGVNYQQFPKVKDKVVSNRFATAIEDLPLMEGLEVEDGCDMLFVFGRERIAQTTARGHVDIDEVYYFYQSVLPQLGWQEITLRLYQREGEQLHINASSANSSGMAVVKFEVKPY